MEFVHFRAEHINTLKVEGPNVEELQYIPRDVYWPLMEAGYAFTAMDGEKVVACFGMVPLYRKVAEIWLVVGSDAEKHAISIVREMKRQRDFLMEHYDGLVAYTIAECEKSKRFVQTCGFEQCGMIPVWGNAAKPFYVWQYKKEGV
jgi:hypothetical protein